MQNLLTLTIKNFPELADQNMPHFFTPIELQIAPLTSDNQTNKSHTAVIGRVKNDHNKIARGICVKDSLYFLEIFDLETADLIDIQLFNNYGFLTASSKMTYLNQTSGEFQYVDSEYKEGEDETQSNDLFYMLEKPMQVEIQTTPIDKPQTEQFNILAKRDVLKQSKQFKDPLNEMFNKRTLPQTLKIMQQSLHTTFSEFCSYIFFLVWYDKKLDVNKLKNKKLKNQLNLLNKSPVDQSQVDKYYSIVKKLSTAELLTLLNEIETQINGQSAFSEYTDTLDNYIKRFV